jgi:mannitol-1-phosphate/altronate dehydrogenase
MKDKTTPLYPNEEISDAVSDYALKHSTKLPKHITDLHVWGLANHEKSNYMISPLQAQFHVWFTKALGVKRGE